MFLSKYHRPAALGYLPGKPTDKSFEWTRDNIGYNLQFGNVAVRLDFEKQSGMFRHMAVHFSRKGTEYVASGIVEDDGIRPYFSPFYCAVKQNGENHSTFFPGQGDLVERQKNLLEAIKSNTDFILSDLRNGSDSAKQIKKAICETRTPDGRMTDRFSGSMKKLFSYQ